MQTERLETEVVSASPLVTLEADLTEDSKYGTRVLTVFADSLIVQDEAKATVFQIPIADIKTARNEPLVSGGRLLVVTKAGEELSVITYSMTRAHLFSEAARGIEQLAEGKEFSINLQKEKTRCDNCGRLLPEKDGVCPNCVKRGKTMMRIAGFLAPYKKKAILLAFASAGLRDSLSKTWKTLSCRRIGAVKGMRRRLTGLRLSRSC